MALLLSLNHHCSVAFLISSTEKCLTPWQGRDLWTLLHRKRHTFALLGNLARSAYQRHLHGSHDSLLLFIYPIEELPSIFPGHAHLNGRCFGWLLRLFLLGWLGARSREPENSSLLLRWKLLSKQIEIDPTWCSATRSITRSLWQHDATSSFDFLCASKIIERGIDPNRSDDPPERVLDSRFRFSQLFGNQPRCFGLEYRLWHLTPLPPAQPGALLFDPFLLDQGKILINTRLVALIRLFHHLRTERERLRAPEVPHDTPDVRALRLLSHKELVGDPRGHLIHRWFTRVFWPLQLHIWSGRSIVLVVQNKLLYLTLFGHCRRRGSHCQIRRHW